MRRVSRSDPLYFKAGRGFATIGRMMLPTIAVCDAAALPLQPRREGAQAASPASYRTIRANDSLLRVLNRTV